MARGQPPPKLFYALLLTIALIQTTALGSSAFDDSKTDEPTLLDSIHPITDDCHRFSGCRDQSESKESSDQVGDDAAGGFKLEGSHFEAADLLETSDLLNSFPDRPLQLVRPDDQHKGLVLVEENLKHLHAITEPVSTVAVVGKYHSGKSFLMNQLMSKTAGFGIGAALAPQTMGIWVWGRPIEVNPEGSKQYLLLLDTEGFAATNVSENYDAKIFAVATLLSSQLLYNSVKIIDQSDIDYLELLARRTQLFALKAQMSPQSDWTGEIFSPQLLHFPSLIWVSVYFF